MWLHASAAHAAIIRPALKHNMPFTVHVPIHVNIWDPILWAHLGTCYVLKLAWWWPHEQPKHVATRDLNFISAYYWIVVSRRKYTYVLCCHTTGWHPLRTFVSFLREGLFILLFLDCSTFSLVDGYRRLYPTRRFPPTKHVKDQILKWSALLIRVTWFSHGCMRADNSV